MVDLILQSNLKQETSQHSPHIISKEQILQQLENTVKLYTFENQGYGFSCIQLFLYNFNFAHIFVCL